MKTTSLKEIASKEVKPSSYLDYRLFFKALYEKRKAAGEYSYQRFAEDLGFKATTVMHQIVQGYRPLTDKAAVQVIESLALESSEAQYLTALVGFRNARTAMRREDHFQKLQSLKKKTLPDEIDKDLLDYFSVWYNPVIWELVGTRGFRADINWISGRIVPHVKPAQVKASLELLERLHLITFDQESGTWKQTQDRVSTGHRIKGLALVSYHSSMIDHAKTALTKVSGKRRDVSAVTVSVDEETALRLRAMIHTFQLQLLDEASRSGVGDQVYQINIQLFPFTE